MERSAEKISSSTLWQTVCEVDYIAASDAVKEAVWMWKFFDELRVAPSIDGPVLLYYDNTRAIAQAKEPRSHQCTKHILRCYHFIWKIMDRGDVNLQKIDKKKNLTDLFTKALRIKKFDDYKSMMDIRYCTD